MGCGGGGNEVKETPQERALAEVALGRYKRYMTKFKDFEGKFIADVTGDTGAQEAKVAGRANADLAQKTATSTPSGIDPSRAGGNAGAIATGETGAKAQVDAQGKVRDQRVEGLQAAIDVGRGTGNAAQISQSGIARDSVREAISDQVNDFNQRQAYVDTAGSLVGTALAIGKNASKPKPAGRMSEFSVDQNMAGMRGASDGPGGYAIRDGKYYWNEE